MVEGKEGIHRPPFHSIGNVFSFSSPYDFLLLLSVGILQLISGLLDSSHFSNLSFLCHSFFYSQDELKFISLHVIKYYDLARKSNILNIHLIRVEYK